MIYLSYMLRAISMAGSYGFIEAEIPVLPIPLVDETLARAVEQTADEVDKRTPLVLLTKEALYFGMVDAFATNLSNVRNKFLIPHEAGAPNLPRLIHEMGRWLDIESENKGSDDPKKNQNALAARSRVAMFVPLEEIPMPIVIQCIAALQGSGLFDKVVVGGGLL